MGEADGKALRPRGAGPSKAQVEAEGPPGCLRVVAFYPAEDDEGLDVAAPLVVEGELVVIRHPARGQFRAVVELQVREARRVSY